MLDAGEGWNPGNSAPWSCSKSAEGACNVSWGYCTAALYISCEQMALVGLVGPPLNQFYHIHH